MKPSETVLLGAGWSEDNIRYELSSLVGGFFELKWYDPCHSSDELKYDAWFKSYSDAYTVYSAVVVSEDLGTSSCTTDDDFVSQAFILEESKRGTVGRIADREICEKCRCYGITHSWNGGCPANPGEVRKNQDSWYDWAAGPTVPDPDDCAPCWFGGACPEHQHEVEDSRRRVEFMVDGVHAKLAAEDQARQEHRAVLERTGELVDELMPLLERVSKSNPVRFKVILDGRTTRSPGSSEEREERTYRIYRWRHHGSAPWKLTIEYSKGPNKWSSGVAGFHRFEVLCHLLGYDKKVVDNEAADAAYEPGFWENMPTSMPW